jgi:Holliday junction resolvase
MTEESKVKTEIRNYLKKNGFHYRAIGSNQYTRKGIPDAYAIKNGHILFIECKSSKGKMSIEQIKEMYEIMGHGGNYIIAYGIDCIKEYCLKNGIQI